MGRDQDHLLALADEAADEAYDAGVTYVQPLYDFRDDIISPAGAALVGILDAGGIYSGSNVEAALQEVPTVAAAAVSGLVIDSIADADTTHAPSRNAVFDALADKAPLASPTFTGDPKAPTPLTSDNDTSIATTAFVKAQSYLTTTAAASTYAPIASPTFTGDPKAPTPLTSDNDTSIATTAFVKAQGYTSNTGTVTSVAVANATGITWTGSPITTSGTLTPTLSTNLQSWSGITPATKADDSGVVHISGTETITGTKTFSANVTTSNGVFMGAQVAPGGVNDCSVHLRLHSSSTGYGLNVTSGQMNMTVGTGGGIAFFTNGSSTVVANMTSGGVFNYGGLEVGYRDIPRVTGGIERGKMYATAAGFTINTGSAAGSTYTVYNDSAAAITLTQGAGLTMRLAGTANTGSRTLAARGIATVWFNSTTECVVSGNVT